MSIQRKVLSNWTCMCYSAILEATGFILPHFEKWFVPIWDWSQFPATDIFFLPMERDIVWNRKTIVFIQHFAIVRTLILYILTRHFYHDFCHVKRYWRQKNYASNDESAFVFFLNPPTFFLNSEPLSNTIMLWQLFVVFDYMFITKTPIEIISKFSLQKISIIHNFIISNLFYIEWE